MFAKQLSVFVENRQGRLEEVLEVLKKNNINILSLSLADTTEYGLLRLIVNDAKFGKEKLTEAGFSTLVSNILIVKIDNKCGSLQDLLVELSKNGINIEYMYGLSVLGNTAYIVMKCAEFDKAVSCLEKAKVKYLTEEDVKKL